MTGSLTTRAAKAQIASALGLGAGLAAFALAGCDTAPKAAIPDASSEQANDIHGDLGLGGATMCELAPVIDGKFTDGDKPCHEWTGVNKVDGVYGHFYMRAFETATLHMLNDGKSSKKATTEPCNDGNADTTNDVCVDGVCKGKP